jgi:vitamin B12 transporter
MTYQATILASAVLLAAIGPSSALAATAAASSGPDDIVITAVRVPVAADRLASAVAILDKQAIDASQLFAVADLLVTTPSVGLTRNGGYGTATSLRIRGAEAEQTVVVIDGVKLNDPSSTGGGFNFANLMTGDIARIEVLRGPQATLWGSQAIGGVVSISTSQPDTPLGGSIDIEAGSRDTVNARAGIGGRTDRLSWRISGGAFTTDGISAISAANGGFEKDGYTNRTASGRLEWTIVDNVTLDLRGYYARGDADLDSDFEADPDTPETTLSEEWLGYAGLNVDLLDGKFRNRLAYTRTNIDRTSRDPRLAEPVTFDARGRNTRFEYQGSFVIAPGWEAVFGAEHEQARMRTASPPFSFADGKADITSAYGQLSITPLAGVSLTGSLRHDDHDTFGGNTSFSGGGAWSLFDGATVLRANYGEGFKAPTLYQLFSEYGNQALTPETASGWEAGVEQRLFDNRIVLSATYYERSSRNLIGFESCWGVVNPGPLCFAPGSGLPRSGFYRNVSRAQARGVELTGTANFGALALSGNFSWTDSEDRSANAFTFGNKLPRRPRHAANASATYVWAGGISTAVALRWADKAFDDTANSRVLDDYTLVDLRGEVPLGRGVSLFGRVENLFDETYETASRYGTLGRSYYAGLRGRF